MQPREFEATRNGLSNGPVPLAISTRETNGTIPWRGRCPKHGGHGTLDVAPSEFTVEKDGIEFALDRDDYEVSYCDECFQEVRDSFSNDVERDADAATVAAEVCRESWRTVKRAFEPAYLAEAGEVSHCPFCGEELASVESHGSHHDDATHATCSEHGPLSLRITQEREPRSESAGEEVEA